MDLFPLAQKNRLQFSKNDYEMTPTVMLKFYLMSFHFIQKENLIQENKALSLRLKIIII